jgi:hypothetical protein
MTDLRQTSAGLVLGEELGGRVGYAFMGDFPEPVAGRRNDSGYQVGFSLSSLFGKGTPPQALSSRRHRGGGGRRRAPRTQEPATARSSSCVRSPRRCPPACRCPERRSCHR